MKGLKATWVSEEMPLTGEADEEVDVGLRDLGVKSLRFEFSLTATLHAQTAHTLQYPGRLEELTGLLKGELFEELIVSGWAGRDEQPEMEITTL